MTARKAPELKSHLCPQCLAPMFAQPEGFFRCTNTACRGEFWPDPVDKAQPAPVDPGNTYICRSMVGTVAPGGSSSGKKYGGKEKMKKKTPHQMYERLCEK